MVGISYLLDEGAFSKIGKIFFFKLRQYFYCDQFITSMLSHFTNDRQKNKSADIIMPGIS